MLIFDQEKFIDCIKKEGISATDPYARQKIGSLIEDLIKNTKYKSGKIIEKVLEISKDYFCGLPDEIAKKELKTLYDRAKEKNRKGSSEEEKKEITLYRIEMENIGSLENENLRKLAFSALITHKYLGQYDDDGIIRYHPYVRLCENDIYHLVDLKNVSGTTKNKLWKRLSDLGFLEFRVNTNPAFKYNSSWIAMPVFKVLINEDLTQEGAKEIFMRVKDYDNIMLYWRYYNGDKNIALCQDCGCPIERENGRRYCRDCAGKRKKTSDKTRYDKRKKSENMPISKLSK